MGRKARGGADKLPVGRAEVREAEAREDAALAPQLKMLVGTCTHPQCIVRANAVEALKAKKSVKRSEGAAVYTDCQNPACPQGGEMHAECFEALERHLQRALVSDGGRKKLAMSDQEAQKAIWTTKYTVIRKECRCACGKGFLRARVGANRASGVMRVGDSVESVLSAADEKKAKLEAELARKSEAVKKAKEEEKVRRKEEAERNRREKLERQAGGAAGGAGDSRQERGSGGGSSDWTCTHCNNINYAFREVCYRCGMPDDGAGPYGRAPPPPAAAGCWVSPATGPPQQQPAHFTPAPPPAHGWGAPPQQPAHFTPPPPPAHGWGAPPQQPAADPWGNPVAPHWAVHPAVAFGGSHIFAPQVRNHDLLSISASYT